MGTSTAGIPHAAIAHLLAPRGSSGAKDHGRHNRIEGRLTRVERCGGGGLISTGGSVIDEARCARPGPMCWALSAFTYGMQKGLTD